MTTNFVGLGIGLITQSIVPRALGPASYGSFSFLTNFFSQVIGFLNLNSSTAFYTKLSQRQEDKGLVSFYFYLILLIGFLNFVFVGLCYLIKIDKRIWPEQMTVFVVMAAFWAFLKFNNDSLVQVADAYGLTTKSETVNMIQKTLGLLIVLFLFWKKGLTLFNYFSFQLILFVVIIGSLLSLIQKYRSPLVSHWHLNSSQLKSYTNEFASFCLPLIIFSFIAILDQILGRWLLQTFSGSMQQGYYSLAYQIGTVCFLFVSAMIPLIMREFSVSFAKKDLDNMRHLFTKYSKMLFTIAAFFGCFLAGESKNVMLIFGGQAYTGAILPISIMCFYPIHQTYGQMNASFFFATERTKTYSNIGISMLFLGLPLTYFLLGPKDYGALETGATGLALKMVFLQVLGVNIQLWFNAKFLNLPFRRFLFHQVLVIIIFVAIAWGCSHIVSSFLMKYNYIIRFLTSGIFYTGMILSLIWFFPWVASLKKAEISEFIIQVKSKWPHKLFGDI